jgi:periplasmic protein TonB
MSSLLMQPSPDGRRLWLACAAATLLHLALLFGLRMGAEPPAVSTLEVTLLAVPEHSRPRHARVLAPVAQSGGGLRQQTRIPSAAAGGPRQTLGLQHAADPGLQTAASPTEALRLLSTNTPAAQAVTRGEGLRQGAEESLQLPRREQAGDSANTYNITTADAGDGSRRAATGLTTRASREAAYRELWRQRVEHAGAANFPWSALAMGQPKSLTLQVTVRADGAVSQARVLRSSGLPMLDRAALDILRIAGPFPPFPDELRRETRELSFAYDWEFFPGDRAALRVGGP